MLVDSLPKLIVQLSIFRLNIRYRLVEADRVNLTLDPQFHHSAHATNALWFHPSEEIGRSQSFLNGLQHSKIGILFILVVCLFPDHYAHGLDLLANHTRNLLRALGTSQLGYSMRYKLPKLFLCLFDTLVGLTNIFSSLLHLGTIPLRTSLRCRQYSALNQLNILSQELNVAINSNCSVYHHMAPMAHLFLLAKYSNRTH